MALTAIFFYLFAILAVASAAMVIVAKNPVHAVLFLILTFFNAAGLFILLGAEFLAMLLVIVYVGAVAVLFLFVVMMLDIDFSELKAEMAKYVPLAGLIGIVILLQFGMIYGVWITAPAAQDLRGAVTPDMMDVQNTKALGLLIYDQYLYLFQTAGLILLVAMIGAIVLTLRHRTDIKRQDVLQQMWRDPAKAMELVDVKSGQGL